MESKSLNGQNYALYRATITGKKKGISNKLKSTLKRYGLAHLLTPSGLHLSTIMPILLIPLYAQIMALLVFYFWISSYGSYLSLERVVTFALLARMSKIKKLNPSPDKIFVACMLISLLTGNVTASPGSFLYSFLFWGTIIIFRDNPVRMIIFMNISLQFISSLSNTPCALSSLIINPLFSSIYMFMFPVFLLNWIFGGIELLEVLISTFLNLWTGSLIWLSSLEAPFTVKFSFFTIILCALFAVKQSWKLVILILLINISNVGEEKQVIKYPGTKIYNKNCKSTYFDLKCRK